MKLDRSLRRESPPLLRTQEALGLSEQSKSGFTIDQDITPENWEYIGKDVKRRLDKGSLYRFSTEAKNLVLLGEKNKSGVGMSQVRTVGVSTARSELDSLLSGIQDSESWKSLADILIDLAVIKPTEAQDAINITIPNPVQDKLWKKFNDFVSGGGGMTSELCIVLALFLLFPEKRQFIRDQIDKVALKKKLKDFFDHPKGGFLIEYGMAYAILFPGMFKDALTSEELQTVCQLFSIPRNEIPLSVITCFYLLSADDVVIDDQGAISVIHQTRPVGQPGRPLPDRKQV